MSVLLTPTSSDMRTPVAQVYIDDAQMAWFEEQLAAAGSRPVVVFTHAPPQGCGLKVQDGGNA
jgi:hypothetical protein